MLPCHYTTSETDYMCSFHYYSCHYYQWDRVMRSWDRIHAFMLRVHVTITSEADSCCPVTITSETESCVHVTTCSCHYYQWGRFIYMSLFFARRKSCHFYNVSEFPPNASQIREAECHNLKKSFSVDAGWTKLQLLMTRDNIPDEWGWRRPLNP